VVAVTNAAGAITASARYDAFGRTLAGGVLPRYGYAGREPDATGLIYYRARYYDPTLGRFTQRDPAGFADGLNPYAYVGNNPVSFTDPLGLNKVAPIASSNVSAYQGSPGAVVGTTIAAQLPRLTTSLPIVENAITRYATPILQAGARALATGPGAALVGMLFPSSLGNPEENWKPSDAGFLPFTSNARDSVYTADELVDTKNIRFTQDSIGVKFKDGRPVQGLIDDLKSGKVSPSDLPPIRIFEKDGVAYTLDNRRLFAAHQAGVQVRAVPATAAEIARELSKKFTTPNQGTAIGIRGSLE
jgi:RHS repeat-associated protein